MLEFYYATFKESVGEREEGEKDFGVRLVQKIVLNKKGVGYRNPFSDPANDYHPDTLSNTYVRVVDEKEHMIWNAFYQPGMLEDRRLYTADNGSLELDFITIGPHMVVFKAQYAEIV